MHAPHSSFTQPAYYDDPDAASHVRQATTKLDQAISTFISDHLTLDWTLPRDREALSDHLRTIKTHLVAMEQYDDETIRLTLAAQGV